MRLIDADALVWDYGDIIEDADGFPTCVVYEVDIRNYPTIDAVPVVRCKDCKHMAVVGVGFRWCKAWERMQTMGDDGFCCFGERRSK